MCCIFYSNSGNAVVFKVVIFFCHLTFQVHHSSSYFCIFNKYVTVFCSDRYPLIIISLNSSIIQLLEIQPPHPNQGDFSPFFASTSRWSPIASSVRPCSVLVQLLVRLDIRPRSFFKAVIIFCYL